MRENKWSNFEIVVLCLLFLCTGILMLNQIFLYTPDSARYLIWANSLASGDGFKDGTTPEPIRYVVHAPMYSVFLSPIAFFFHEDVIAAKVLTLLVGCATLFAVYFWLRRKIEKPYALLGTLLLALNPLMLVFSTQILSDVPFALCLVFFFMTAEKIIDKQKENKYYAALVALAVIGIFLREVGLSLMVASAAFFIWKKKYSRAAYIVLVPMIFYFLWLYRNEVIIASSENPSLRNLQLYFTHAYTSGESAFLNELLIRLWKNLIVYSGYFAKSLFMPGFALTSNKLISIDDPFISLIYSVIPYLQYLLIAAWLGFAAFGIMAEYKKSKIFFLVLIFLVCYVGFILFYPFIDIRFLFPLMIVILYFFSIGLRNSVKWLSRRIRRNRVYSIVTGLFLILVLPNLCWLQNYVSNSWEYSRSNDEGFRDSNLPEMFNAPLHLAAKWLDAHTDSSAIIFSFWKELGIWLDGRKVIVGRSLIPPDQFDNQLRDYGIKYVVAVHSKAALNECEPLFARSKRFGFLPVHEIGNVRIFEVLDKKSRAAADQERGLFLSSSIDALYHSALYFMDENPKWSKDSFSELVRLTEGSPVMKYYLGVSEEFLGNLDTAKMIFSEFSAYMQAGIFAQMARQHLDIISQLEKIRKFENPYECEIAAHTLAKKYWGLGYINQAVSMLRRALEIDSTDIQVTATYAFYSFQLGDFRTAEKLLTKIGQRGFSDPFTENLISVMQINSKLRKISNPDDQISLRKQIIGSYLITGLLDHAIDEARELRASNPSDTTVPIMLGRIYEMKYLYEPALRSYKAVLMLDPENDIARRRIQALSARF